MPQESHIRIVWANLGSDFLYFFKTTSEIFTPSPCMVWETNINYAPSPLPSSPIPLDAAGCIWQGKNTPFAFWPLFCRIDLQQWHLQNLVMQLCISHHQPFYVYLFVSCCYEKHFKRNQVGKIATLSVSTYKKKNRCDLSKRRDWTLV